MKKFQLSRLVAMCVVCLAVGGHAAYSQPSQIVGKAPKATAADIEDGTPPSYMLLIAGLSAVVFIGARRSRS